MLEKVWENLKLGQCQLETLGTLEALYVEPWGKAFPGRWLPDFYRPSRACLGSPRSRRRGLYTLQWSSKNKVPSVYWHCITWKHAQETRTIHWMSYAEKSHRLPGDERFHHMCPAGSSQLRRADSRRQTQLCLQWSTGSLQSMMVGLFTILQISYNSQSS